MKERVYINGIPSHDATEEQIMGALYAGKRVIVVDPAGIPIELTLELLKK